jgi:prolyl-tRNA synthetase
MQRWSKLFIPTLREAPADAEVASHKFLVRAGYIRQLSAGLYDYLFLAQRSILKITAIIREEMDKIGQEFYLPALNPKELWESSGRWSVMGDNMFRLKDRKGAELCLGMTHEEVMTDIARRELRSYKQLPQIWYQIQTKFRDEPRPKSGLLRVRQFTMKDAYSFDIDQAGLDKSYELHAATYHTIFSRCGLSVVGVEAHSGAMGGTGSTEFMVYTDAGEDFVASCPKCGYAANLEKATSQLAPVADLEGDAAPELIHTPGMGAIADIVAFLKLSAAQDIKTVAYMAQSADSAGKLIEQPVIAFLRGDHTVNETKLATVAGATELRPMHAEELALYFQAPAGFLGPIGLTVRPKELLGLWPNQRDEAKKNFPALASVIDDPRAANVVVDPALLGRKNMICGANKEDYHLKNVTPGRDFSWTVSTDIRNVEAGEGCPKCGEPLRLGKTVEIGHIFKLGYKYTESMGVRVLDQNGRESTPIMGCYGIGIERILTSAIEQNHDENGFWLPPAIAPFQVIVTPVNIKNAEMAAAALDIATRLEKTGLDVLFDDRDERPGVKFKDADLIGVPVRINIGKKLPDGIVELVRRSTGESSDATISGIEEAVAAVLAAESK